MVHMVLKSLAAALALALIPGVVLAAPDPAVLSPAPATIVFVGQKIPVKVSPAGATLAVISGLAKTSGNTLLVIGPGEIVIVARSGDTASPTVSLQAVRLENASLGLEPAPAAASQPTSAPPAAPAPATAPPPAMAPSAQPSAPGSGGAPSFTPQPVSQPTFDPPTITPQPAGAPTAPLAAAVRTDRDHYEDNLTGAQVSIKELPKIQTNQGVTAAPLEYTSGMAVDADGAGNAWRQDPTGQRSTSFADKQGFLDPTKDRYVVLPSGFMANHPGVHLGDIVAVTYKGKTVYAMYGDSGPASKIGEASESVASALGINANPVHGGVGSGVTYVVFPGSGTGSRLSNAQLDQRGSALMAASAAMPAPTTGMVGALTGH
jgi:hypothetical protein